MADQSTPATYDVAGWNPDVRGHVQAVMADAMARRETEWYQDLGPDSHVVNFPALAKIVTEAVDPRIVGIGVEVEGGSGYVETAGRVTLEPGEALAPPVFILAGLANLGRPPMVEEATAGQVVETFFGMPVVHDPDLPADALKITGAGGDEVWITGLDPDALSTAPDDLVTVNAETPQEALDALGRPDVGHVHLAFDLGPEVLLRVRRQREAVEAAAAVEEPRHEAVPASPPEPQTFTLTADEISDLAAGRIVMVDGRLRPAEDGFLR